MKITFFHIFKKNGLILLFLFFCFLIIKALSVTTFVTKNDELINKWAIECNEYDSEELTNYISSLGSEILINKDTNKKMLYQYSKLNASFKNYKKVNNLISFAEQLEGELPTALPYDYMNRLDFYKNLDSPSVINENKLDNYFKLQKYSVIPFVVVILVAFFGGMHYETDMYKFVQITTKGRAFFCRMKLLIFMICLMFLIINEITDLICSGLLSDRITLGATLQSYSIFSNSQISLSIGECVMFLMLIKIISLYILTQITYFITRSCKNTKDSIITSFSIFLVCYLVGESLIETRYYPFLLFGIVDWKQIIKNVVILRSVEINTLTAGFLVVLFIAVLISIKHFISFIKKVLKNKETTSGVKL